MITGGVPTDGETLSQQSDGNETDESVDRRQPNRLKKRSRAGPIPSRPN